MPNPAPGFVARPDHRVDLLPERRRVKVVFGGMTVADSNAALRVEETGHEPVHYLPEKDVRLDLMRATGYRAEPFLSGETFLTSSDCFDCDCIIADIHMPGMGGFDLVRELHGQGIMTPVILITALPDQHLNDEAVSIGALCLLRKPFETSSLLDCVERSLLR